MTSFRSFAATARSRLAGLPDCALCLAPAASGYLCIACEQALPVAEAAQGGNAAAAYAFPLDRLVWRFKFGADFAAGRWLAGRLAACVTEDDRPDLILAVPLARGRLRERGFNQALFLARRVARRLRVPVEARTLRKVRETASQAGLSRRARAANLRGAFSCRRRLDGLHVAVVDDVATTGATGEAIARVLREAGAARVSLWVAARTDAPFGR